jgi:hypothetical protein
MRDGEKNEPAAQLAPSREVGEPDGGPALRVFWRKRALEMAEERLARAQRSRVNREELVTEAEAILAKSRAALAEAEAPPRSHESRTAGQRPQVQRFEQSAKSFRAEAHGAPPRLNRSSARGRRSEQAAARRRGWQ